MVGYTNAYYVWQVEERKKSNMTFPPHSISLLNSVVSAGGDRKKKRLEESYGPYRSLGRKGIFGKLPEKKERTYWISTAGKSRFESRVKTTLLVFEEKEA